MIRDGMGCGENYSSEYEPSPAQRTRNEMDRKVIIMQTKYLISVIQFKRLICHVHTSSLVCVHAITSVSVCVMSLGCGVGVCKSVYDCASVCVFE